MRNAVTGHDISIRTELRPGDIGYIIHLHGRLYKEEYNYGISFESYVAAGLHEFWQQYDPLKDRIWICEHHNTIVGSMVLMHRPDNKAQLRYFLLEPAYRGIGLGKKLMGLFLEFYAHCGYNGAWLLTTAELDAAASLYTRHGFRLIEEKRSSVFFEKEVVERRYELDKR
jgi:GNAT superfamily N-acetyltransferase